MSEGFGVKVRRCEASRNNKLINFLTSRHESLIHKLIRHVQIKKERIEIES